MYFMESPTQNIIETIIPNTKNFNIHFSKILIRSFQQMIPI